MSAASTPGSAPKSMSSRLLTMKFMQRAAATPSLAFPTQEEPYPKRRKKDSDSPGRPSFDVNTLVNQRAVEAAAIAEDAKRQAALERAAAESGDTRWVLSFEDERATASMSALRVVQTGYANLDVPSSIRPIEVDIEEDKPVMVGRRSFGKFNKKLEKNQADQDDSYSSSEVDEEDSREASYSDDPTNELIRASRRETLVRAKADQRVKKRAGKANLENLAKDRKKKEVNLNKLTSISGSISCYICGGNHIKADCPQKSKRGYPGGGDDGPSRKAIKTR